MVTVLSRIAVSAARSLGMQQRHIFLTAACYSSTGPPAQAFQSEKEQRLLSASKRFDAGFSRYDLSQWNGLLHEDVVLHKDKLTLREDIHGIDAVKAYFQVGLTSRGHGMPATLLPFVFVGMHPAPACRVCTEGFCNRITGLHQPVQLRARPHLRRCG